MLFAKVAKDSFVSPKPWNMIKRLAGSFWAGM